MSVSVRSRRPLLAGLLALTAAGACLTAAAATAPAADAQQDCHVGTYRLSDTTLIDVAPSVGPTLRWRRLDGETGALKRSADGQWTSTYGWTGRSDGHRVSFSSCATGGMRFDGLTGQRLRLEAQDTTFESGGITLKGRLVMPPGQDPVPVVVLVHGSEDDSGLRTFFLQRLFPAQGIGAFVYDKRGTGISGGHYTQDFNVLAADAVAAMRAARHLAGSRLTRIGYHGGSEGGWVAPLAAERAPVDFVIVAFGLAVGVLDEDQEAVEIQLRELGYSAQDIKNAQELAHAAEMVFVHDFKDGFKELAALEAKYQHAPWYPHVHGDFAFMILGHSETELRAMAQQYDWHTPFDYDPMATLRASTTPQLWVIGGEDYDAPSGETRARILSLIKDGRPFTLAYYPHAEHGLTLFETDKDGERLSTRYAGGYFTMMSDFIRDGRLKGPYGDAQLTAAQSPAR
jgi:uncharacterized protein